MSEAPPEPTDGVSPGPEESVETSAAPVAPGRVRGRKRRAMKRGTRWIVIALAATIATVIFTVFTVDIGNITIAGRSLRSIAEARASKYLEREMTIGRVVAHVTPGRFEFQDVVIKGPFGDSRPFFSAKRITVDFPWWTLFTKEINVDVRLYGWRMVVEKFADGKTHIPKLTPTRDPNAPEKPSSFKFRNLAVYAIDGEFVYDDHVTPWTVTGPNLNFAIVRANNLNTYTGNAAFTGGVVQIQHFEPMSASLRTWFQVDNGIVKLKHIDLVTDGAETHLDGVVNFRKFPEQEYNIQSTVDFARMRQLFWSKATWRMSGLGDFKGVFKIAQGGGFDLSGLFSSNEAGLGLGSGEWRFPDLHGSLQWVPGSFRVPHADSDFLGGHLHLSYGIDQIGMPGGAIASLTGDYDQVDAYRFTRQFNFSALEPQGRMRGHVSMGWKNSDFSGTLQAHGTTAIQPAGGAVAAPVLPASAPEIPAEVPFQKYRPLGPFPVAGDLTYRFTGASLDFQPSWIATPSTYVKFSGHAAGAASNVLFHVTSHDWQRSDRLFAAIMANAGHPVGAIEVGGRGTFDGTLTRSFSAPRIEGQFVADDMRAWHEKWGHATGHIAIDNGYLTVTDGRVERPDGGRVLTSGRFALGYPRADGGEEIHAHIRAEEMPLEPLRHAFELEDWPIDGVLAVADLNLTGAYEKPGGTGTMRLERGTAWDEPFDSATGNLTFEGDGSVRLGGIEIVKGAGKITGDASLSWAESKFFIVAAGQDLPVETLRNFRIENAPLSGVLNFKVHGEGSYDAPTWQIDGEVPDLYVGDEGIGAIRGRIKLESNILSGDVAAGSGVSNRLQASCNGSMALTGEYLANVSCRFIKTSIDPYFRFISFIGRDLPFTKVILTGNVNLAGPLQDASRLAIDARVDDAAITLFDYALANDGPLLLTMRKNAVTLEQVKFTGEGTRLQITGGLDVAGRTANLKADGDAGLGLLQAFYPSLTTGGKATLQASMTGGFDDLALAGQALIVDGRLKHVDFTHGIEQINGPITMEAGRISVDGLHGVIGEGRMDFSGAILLKGYRPEEFQIDANGQSMHLRVPEGLRSTVNADLTLRGPVDHPLLAGNVYVLTATYAPHINPTTGYLGVLTGAVDTSVALPKPVETEASTFPMGLAIRVQATRLTVIESKATNTLIEATADVTIGGTISHPTVAGRVDVDRGEWDFNGNHYRLQTGSVDFTNPSSFDPFFEMTAETDARSLGQRYTVQVRVTGTLDKLAFLLRSEPFLPEFQIISLLLGETADLTQAEFRARTDPNTLQTQALGSVAFSLLTSPISATVGSAVQRVTTLTAQIVPMLYGNEANLQQINPSARIILGRPVSKRIYVSWSHSLSGSQNDVVLVQYDQTDQVSWVFSRNEDRSFALDFRLRYVIK